MNLLEKIRELRDAMKNESGTEELTTDDALTTTEEVNQSFGSSLAEQVRQMREARAAASANDSSN